MPSAQSAGVPASLTAAAAAAAVISNPRVRRQVPGSAIFNTIKRHKWKVGAATAVGVGGYFVCRSIYQQIKLVRELLDWQSVYCQDLSDGMPDNLDELDAFAEAEELATYLLKVRRKRGRGNMGVSDDETRQTSESSSDAASYSEADSVSDFEDDRSASTFRRLPLDE
eukprot:Selendium_serpulae@DN10478_c0_g1_i1.p1